jgi:hypothetical protein
MLRPLLSLFFMFAPSVAFAQIRAGSAAEYNYMRDAQRNAARAQIAWDNAKKITRLKPEIVKNYVPKEFIGLTKVVEGWEGDLASVGFEVLNVKNDKEMLLLSGDDVIWLIGFPTKEFTSDQEVRILGPVKAGPTKSYSTAAGSTKTVRTFTLVEGEALAKFEREYEESAKRNQLQAERERVESLIKDVVKSIIWGKQDAVHPRSMEKLVLKKYKEELEQVGPLHQGLKDHRRPQLPDDLRPQKETHRIRQRGIPHHRHRSPQIPLR